MPAPLGDIPNEDFRRIGHEIVDWIADYWDHPERYRVLPDVEPGQLIDKLPASGPEAGEPLDKIFEDFQNLVMPHVTHWNHPGFMAYFANTGSAPGVLAETLIAALNNVGLLWKTSPAMAELEQLTLRWLAEWLGFPKDWFGIIHSTASEGALHALIAAREHAEAADLNKVVVYTSQQAHMCVEKGMAALGHGSESCRLIACDDQFRMLPHELESAIKRDLEAGLTPIAVSASVGTTSTSSVDPIPAIADLCERYNLWLHVDAAYAGPCAMLPEKREHFAGCDRADSLVLNPHKWMFSPMDLTVFYTRQPEAFRKAMGMQKEYLPADPHSRAVNFMEYSIPLGRRFRGLKLWFIMRAYGREGIMANLREHIRLAEQLAGRVDEHPDFERLAPTPFSLVCFRYRPSGTPVTMLNQLNERLLNAVNETGEFFLSNTILNGQFTIRVAIGNIRTDQAHLDRLWETLCRLAP